MPQNNTNQSASLLYATDSFGSVCGSIGVGFATASVAQTKSFLFSYVCSVNLLFECLTMWAGW